MKIKCSGSALLKKKTHSPKQLNAWPMFKTIPIIFYALLFLFACREQKTQQTIVKTDSSSTPVISEEIMEAKNTDTSSVAPEWNTAPASINLTPQLIKLQKGDSFYVNVPNGYEIHVAAEINQRLRFLAISPDGKLFATDMVNTSDNKKGRVLVFENWNDSSKRFRSTSVYL